MTSESKENREMKRKYVWTIMNYNFKSNLTFYNVFDNNNNKMTISVYRNCILESIVKLWIMKIKNNKTFFTLEEDDDSEHESRKKQYRANLKEEQYVELLL